MNSDLHGPIQDKRLRAKANIWGLESGSLSKAYDETSLYDERVLNDTLDESPLVILALPDRPVRFFSRKIEGREDALQFAWEDGRLIDQETKTVWNYEGQALNGPLQGAQLEPLMATPSFWYAWVLYHPQTDVFPQN